MNIAIIFAGGVGARMSNTGVPKQFLKVYGKPILIHTLEKFQDCPAIDAIVLACVESHLQLATELAEQYAITKLKRIVAGGSTGQASIYAALKAAADLSTSSEDIVLIHDGVRPLINSKLIEDNIKTVRAYGSCITCAQTKETVALVDKSGAITMLTQRPETKLARAPQSFYLTEILEAHERALADGLTDIIDSCTLMMNYGKTLQILECDSQNIKITTFDDYFLFKAILEMQQDAAVFEFQLEED
ncbi:MAG: 2-C-methyl-D-erythritol 4-phosphate cytidylyltransferase [Actinomycetia bacterium]|nr:2-C-methyl-D-erythritol 4-phosphate cytidylyltransferase [Actinomycetes bacterium]